MNLVECAKNANYSWKDFFNEQQLKNLYDIENKIGNNFTPNIDNVLLFVNIDISNIKVVILGQDPYPQPNVATGRAFEVGNISEWDELKKNASLKNILKLLHKNYFVSKDIPKIDEVRDDIKSGKFPIKKPYDLFRSWEEQGVLLLNTSLTCEIDHSNSHVLLWEQFTRELIKYIYIKNQKCKWFLWGKFAENYCNFINNKTKLICAHPRLHSYSAGSFFYENHFSKVDTINWY